MTGASLRLSRYPLGLSLSTHDLRYPLPTVLAIAAIVGGAVSLADIFVFSSVLPPGYVRLAHELPVAERILFIGGKSLLDEVAYRLGVMTLLVWAASLVWRPNAAIYWAAIVLAQLINILLGGTLPATPLAMVFCVVRIELPGILWGYLYWRHGFAVAALTHASSHLFVQPALTFFL